MLLEYCISDNKKTCGVDAEDKLKYAIFEDLCDIYSVNCLDGSSKYYILKELGIGVQVNKYLYILIYNAPFFIGRRQNSSIYLYKFGTTYTSITCVMATERRRFAIDYAVHDMTYSHANYMTVTVNDLIKVSGYAGRGQRKEI